jgi:hypothetical protein
LRIILYPIATSLRLGTNSIAVIAPRKIITEIIFIQKEIRKEK